MNEGFQRIPRPFIRSKAEEEKKENLFDQPMDIISDRFFDGFVRQNLDTIRADNLGILGQNLNAEVSKLIAMAKNEKGDDFATGLERYILDDLKNCRFLVPDQERDSLVKRQIEQELAKDLKEKGLEIEEEQ